MQIDFVVALGELSISLAGANQDLSGTRKAECSLDEAGLEPLPEPQLRSFCLKLGLCILFQSVCLAIQTAVVSHFTRRFVPRAPTTWHNMGFRVVSEFDVGIRRRVERRHCMYHCNYLIVTISLKEYL